MASKNKKKKLLTVDQYERSRMLTVDQYEQKQNERRKEQERQRQLQLKQEEEKKKEEAYHKAFMTTPPGYYYDKNYQQNKQLKSTVLDWVGDVAKRNLEKQSKNPLTVLTSKKQEPEYDETAIKKQAEYKRAANVYEGTADLGNWLSGRTQDVEEALSAKNAKSIRETANELKEYRYFDKGSDVNLWSPEKRAQMREASQKTIDEAQKAIEETQKQLDELNLKAYRTDGKNVQMRRYDGTQGLELQLTDEDRKTKEELEKKKNTYQAKIDYANDYIKKINAQDEKDQKYRELIDSQQTGDTEWHEENINRQELKNWDTALKAASPDGIKFTDKLERVDGVYAALDPNYEPTGDIVGADYKNAILMNDEERNAFISLYNAGKKAEAWSFYEGLQPYLNQAYNYFEKLSINETARRLPVLSSIATEVAHVAQPLEAIMNLPEQIAGALGAENAATDPYSERYIMTRVKNGIRAQVASDAGDWGWVYQGAMSGVDSFMNIALAQGMGLTNKVINVAGRQIPALQTATLALFHTQAFETSLQNTISQGNDQFGYDFIEAWVDAAIETATEIWSVENWLADPKNLLTYVGKIAISEPSEEIVGAVVEPIVKEMIGHKHQYKERANEIIANGGYYDNAGRWIKVDDMDDATRKAMQEWFHDIRMAAQEALVSVGPSIGMGSIKLANQNVNIGRELNPYNEEQTTKQIAEAAAELGEGTDSSKGAQKVQEKLEQGKKVSNYRMGQLAQDVLRESGERAAETAKQTRTEQIGRYLQENGVSEEEAAGLAETVEKAIEKGGIENLTKKERQTIHDNQAATNALYRFGITKEGMADTQTQKALAEEVKNRTQKEENAVKSISDLLTKNAERRIVLREATPDEISETEGERINNNREAIVYDRKTGKGRFAEIEGVEVKKRNGNWDLRLKIAGQERTMRASEVKLTNYQAAQIINQATNVPELYSEGYTKLLLDAANEGQFTNENVVPMMREAKKLRLYSFADYLSDQMPQTELPQQLAEKVWSQSIEEHYRNRKNQVTEYNKQKTGRAVFGDAVFGTQEWTDAVKGLDQDTVDWMETIAGIAQRAGIDVSFKSMTDNDKTWGWEGKEGIGLNISGRNYVRDLETNKVVQTGQHDMMITFGHELTHWLGRNSLQGYNRLEKFVLQNYINDNGYEKFEERINHRMYSMGESLEEAIAEIVADSCDQILLDEQVQQKIAQTDSKLFSEIKGFVNNLVERFKKAIKGTAQESASQYSKAMAAHINEIRKLWLGAYDEVLSEYITDENGKQLTPEEYRQMVAEETGTTAEEISRMSQAELDSAYMDAVENGTEQQQMLFVNEAAERGGYVTEFAYHGTPFFGFTTFDTGRSMNSIFVTYSRELAQIYANDAQVKRISERAIGNIDSMTDEQLLEVARRYITERAGDKVNSIELRNGKFRISYYDSLDQRTKTLDWDRRTFGQMVQNAVKNTGAMNGVYQLYTRPGRQLVLDAKQAKSNEIKLDGQIAQDMGTDTFNTRMIAKWARENGYDSVRINNVTGNQGIVTDYGVFFNAQDVKSADPVTYDESGNVIPVTERFNAQKKDVRFSKHTFEGEDYILVDTPAFDGRTDVALDELRDYIKNNIRGLYTIIESGQKVLVTKLSAKEYAYSGETNELKNKNPDAYSSKANTASQIREIIENLRRQNREHEYGKHKSAQKAKYGLYKYGTTFAIKLKDQYYAYDADVLILNYENGNKEFYDIIIKNENTALEQHLLDKARRSRAVSSDNSIAEDKENGNTRKSRAELDNAYMDAVESGNMEAAQRMADEAANRAGFYTDEYGYHGTPGFGFTIWNMGDSQDEIFVSYSDKMAATYTHMGELRKIGKKYQNMGLDIMNIKDLAKELKDFYENFNPVIQYTDIQSTKGYTSDEFADVVFNYVEEIKNLAKGKSFEQELSKDIDKVYALAHTGNKVEARTQLKYLMDKTGRIDFSNEDEIKDKIRNMSAFMVDALASGEDVVELNKGGWKYYITRSDFIRQIDNLMNDKEGIYKLYTRPGEQWVIDAKGANWNNIQIEDRDMSHYFYGDEDHNRFTTREIAAYVKARHPYLTSIRINNVYDHGGRQYSESKKAGYGDIAIFFNQEDVKSADPVTYDDNGNVIPLSERFNDQKADIRWSRAQLDNEYMAAVESGDTARQQELVDQAAEKAFADSKMRTSDGKLRKLYHGTWSDTFTVFDPKWIGTAREGDVGFFGRGFYFAYTKGEAGFYGGNVMEVFLDIKKPFNYRNELNQIDGQETSDYNARRAVFIVNFAEKFPELAQDHKVTVWEKGSDTGKEISLKEFAEEYRKIIDSKKFHVQEVKTEYGTEWLAWTDKKKVSYTNEDGETFSWDEYGYQKRFFTEEDAKNQLNNAYMYLSENVYDNISIQNPTTIIQETDFSGSVKRMGYDGIIQSEEGDEAVVFDSSQIKLADPVTYDDNGNVIPLSERFNKNNQDIRFSRADIDSDYMAAVNSGNTASEQELIYEAGRQAGYAIKAFHGTGRADRVGTVFRPERATSGPMAFFTDNREIAEGYAKDKRDTSIAYDDEYGDYYNQFRINIRGKNVPVGKLWSTLSFADRQKITEAAKHITLDDDAENIVWDENAQYGIGNFTDYERKLHGWNSIDTLIDGWLEGGTLWQREGDFLKVLEMAGIKGVTWNDPNARDEKVYDVLLKIQNPFVVSEMYNNQFLENLEAWWKKQNHEQYEHETANTDPWDKNNITVDEWIKDGFSDVENGVGWNWTRIPDGVTAYLKELGYDGIQDDGGKGGGKGHTVWIPFSSEQVKSADPVTYDDEGNIIMPTERFNESKKDIRWSRWTESGMDVNYWMEHATPSMVQTEDERELISMYRGKRTSISLSLKKQGEYRARIRQLEAVDNPSTDVKSELTALRNKLEIEKKKVYRLEEEILQITRNDGWAGMMYQHNMVFRDYVEGRTQEQVRQTIDDMLKLVEQTQEQITKDTENLKKLATHQAVQTMKSFMGKTSMGRMASILRKTYNSTMNKAEIEDRLAEMALKQASGKDITSDTEALAQDLLDKMRGIRTDALESLRGQTFVIGQSLAEELRKENSSIKELQSRIKGSGVKIVTGVKSSTGEIDKHSRISEQWSELRESNAALPDVENMAEIDKLHTIVDFIESELRTSTGAEQFGIDFDEVAAMVRASVGNITTYLTDDPKARAQINNLMKQIADLSKATEKTAEDMQGLYGQLDDVVQAGARAKGIATAMERDVNEAIKYYNTTARVAAEKERTKVRKALIAQLRDENTQKLLKQQEKYRSMIENQQKARELHLDNEALRRKISTVASRMASRLFAETDQKNVPEETKGLVREVLRMLAEHDSIYRRVTNWDKDRIDDALKRLTRLSYQSGEFVPAKDLDFLVIKAPNEADNDYTLRDKVWQDILDIESGLEEYRAAETSTLVNQQAKNNALTKVQEALSEIYSVIRARSEAFINGKRYEIATLAEQMENEMAGSKYKGEKTGKVGRAISTMEKMVGYGNLTPEYFFKNLKNGVMNILHGGFHDAEQRAGLEALRAKTVVEQIAKDTKYNTWDPQEKHKVKLQGGREIEMTTEQIMALYATWMRESSQLRPEETAHLLKGGFVLAQGDMSEGLYGRQKNDQRPIRMDKATLDGMSRYLTEEQLQYVNKLVEYMSGELAEIGNETSMQQYGIKKFTERFYYPIKAWGGVLNKSSASGIVNKSDARAMRQSFTKNLTANAQNAIEIGDFTPTVMNHIVGMITFNTVGPAVENMNKVLNQQLTYGEAVYDENGEITEDTRYKRNVRAAFQDAYGANALKYLERFMDDVNGGMTRQQDKSVQEKLLSVFRKSAVAGSLSVAAQQPLSYIRAAMEINPVYLARALSPTNWGKIHDEMLKYSGVAVIKDMGRFDMNQGQSMIDYITPEEKISKARKAGRTAAEMTTILPEKMDALTWGRMWIACKMETAAKNKGMDTNSDEFLQKVAQRFNEVMRKTQVYDSLMVKSQNMRSTNYAIKAMTSFMAEPTLSLNVLADAVRNFNSKGGKATMAKAFVTFITSAAAQALVKAIMSSGRSPDKKKRLEEQFYIKWMNLFMSEGNPLTLVPGYSDIIELLKNGELADDAWSVIGKLRTVLTTGFKWATGKSDNPYRSFEDTIGQLAQLMTNVPLKNLMRDARAMYNFMNPETYAQREYSPEVVKYGIEANFWNADNMIGVVNSYLKDAGGGFETSQTAYIQRIYDAERAGNKAEAEALKKYVVNTSTAKDPEKTVKDKIRNLYEKDESLSGPEKVQVKLDAGQDVKTIKSWITQNYKQAYIDADTNGRRQLMNELTKMYKLLGISGNDAMKIVTKWVKDEKKK